MQREALEVIQHLEKQEINKIHQALVNEAREHPYRNIVSTKLPPSVQTLNSLEEKHKSDLQRVC